MSAKNPLVFITVTTFNEHDYIENTIQNLIGQTHGNLKILVLDNNSTDDTVQICGRLAAKDGRIQIKQSTVNSGPFNAWRALAHADGDYFMMASADDYHHPDFVRRAVDILNEDPSVGLVYARTMQVDRFGNFLGAFPDDMYYETDPSDPVAAATTVMSRIVSGDAFRGMFRRSVLEKCYIQHFLVDDFVTVTEASLYGRIKLIPDFLYFRRIDEQKSHWDFCLARCQEHWRGMELNTHFVDPVFMMPYISMFWDHLRMFANARIPDEAKVRLMENTRAIFHHRFRQNLETEIQVFVGEAARAAERLQSGQLLAMHHYFLANLRSAIERALTYAPADERLLAMRSRIEALR